MKGRARARVSRRRRARLEAAAATNAAMIREDLRQLDQAVDDQVRATNERAIAGALRAAIKDHGPITPERIGSATKRVLGNLKNARPGPARRGSITAAEMARRRWAGTTAEERQASARKAGLAGGRKGALSRWAKMSPEERRREMSRRRRKGLKKP